MKHIVKGTYEDPKIDYLAKDTAFSFKIIPNFTVVKVTTLWNPPFRLGVPYGDGTTRITPPDVVKCERAVLAGEFVTPGGCSWESVGTNQVRIDRVDGLEEGKRYDLTFLVIGS